MDEITLLNGNEVSNKEYINNNLLFNPEVQEKFSSTSNIFFKDKKGIGLHFKNLMEPLIMEKYKQQSYSYILKDYNAHLPNISYNKHKNILFSDYLLLDYYKDLTSQYVTDDGSIETGFAEYPMFQAASIEKLKEKMDFIRFNIYEQNIQLFDRYYIHENSFILSPINEMKLGRDKGEIFSQYGFFSVMIVDKIMDVYGGFSINNYEKAKKTIDLIYYFIAIVFIFYFFKDNHLRLIFILFSGIAFFSIGHYSFIYAPNVTSFKHLLDLLIVLLFFKYSGTFKTIVLILIALLSILSLWISKDFGEFIFLATLGAFILPFGVTIIRTKRIDKRHLFFMCLILFTAILSLKFYPLMENPSIRYFFDGFYSFPFSSNILYFLVLIVVFLQWLFLFCFYQKLEEKKYLFSYIFLLFYTEFLFTYFIWSASIHALISYLFIYALPLMIIYNLFDFRYKNYFSLSIIFILTIGYSYSAYTFIQGKINYNDIFKTHKLYQWDNKRAGGILSTYSFADFQNSIDLIKKYNPETKFYMISKYDNILGIFSEKYSGFPFFELRSTIVTKYEYQKIKQIIEQNANLLFVDNDIDKDFLEEMNQMSYFDIEPYWRNESWKQRIPKLQTLKNLFNEVKDNYELVEKGTLISVYRKK
ncbi:hypothetical protein EOM39_06145 [Candidatus Gracilibacteria bacterium]|nr:hypothetical protein [Candidatus Gracilibacteria bacterium]